MSFTYFKTPHIILKKKKLINADFTWSVSCFKPQGGQLKSVNNKTPKIL